MWDEYFKKIAARTGTRHGGNPDPNQDFVTLKSGQWWRDNRCRSSILQLCDSTQYVRNGFAFVDFGVYGPRN